MPPENKPSDATRDLANGSHGKVPGDGLPTVAPDFIEEEVLLDNIVPTRGYQLTPLVGLGGSAGSIRALGEFFKAMPPESGMAFVVILHLSPTHESAMAELLARSTTMPVCQATNGQQVQPNHVYVIPPAKYLTALDGQLKLTDMDDDRGRRVAVDLFFRSLADSHGAHSAAIVLSGADGDGALGIKRVKECGGLTIAQDPEEAEYPSMPRSAIDTGMVDWVLEISQMPGRLIEYRYNAGRVALPPEEGPQPMLVRAVRADANEAALRDVLLFLRTRTGRDFSYYKRATILRRIGRRMQVNGVETLPDYLNYLRTHLGEAGALLQDLLISVTNFFRDREAFDAVASYIPELFKGKSADDTLRIWVPACATGEEAYSFAMLLLEHADTLVGSPALQVFGCDLDEDAIQYARAGHYPEAITADVSEERLRRFFTKDHRGYRVRRELREMVLFATHDLLKDAPFSRTDLISCRNLLIYLTRDAQHRVFETFHFSLKPGGRLFLGTSESVEDDSPLFRPLDKKHRIYEPQAVTRIGLPVPTGNTLLRAVPHAGSEPRVVHGIRFGREASVPFHHAPEPNLDRAALAEIHLRLIERMGPPSVIVNADHDIIHLSDTSNRFLRFVGGEPTLNLLRIVSPELRTELRAALFRAAESQAEVETVSIPVEAGGESRRVIIRVSPAEEVDAGSLLVVFDERPGGPRAADLQTDAGPAATDALAHLEWELEHVKRNLRGTVEQYETTTEELRASNEELQAMNEELRSATEELETGREELQSINEELTTVNQEMKDGMDNLTHANADLQNLVASTSIATVFLDRALTIKRYTPMAVELFRLIPSDVGRPLSDLKHQLDYPDMHVDADAVLRTLVPVQREVRSGDHWYVARLQPYRTLEDQIAGVVLTFIDVTEQKLAGEQNRIAEERFRFVIDSATDYAVVTLDHQRRVDSWSRGAELLFGYAESEILRQSGDLLFIPEDRAGGEPDREAQMARDKGRAEYRRWHARKDGSKFFATGAAMSLRDSTGELTGFDKILRDETQGKREQESASLNFQTLQSDSAAAGAQGQLRVADLQREINELCRKAGEPPRYAVDGA